MAFRLFTAVIILGTIQSSVFGQTPESDSSFLAQAIRYRRAISQSILADNARLYNGTDYKEPILHDYDKGHPYFITPEWQKGFIEYDGQRYENVDLLYDLVHDKVLTHQYYTLKKIDLIQENVAFFGVKDHTFIRILAKDSLGKFLQPGFYDLLWRGEVSIYAQRRKERTEDLTSGRVVQEFSDKNAYFIVKGKNVFQIKTKKDLFTVLGDRKSLIKSKLAENRIRFRKQKEAALILAAKLYNSAI